MPPGTPARDAKRVEAELRIAAERLAGERVKMAAIPGDPPLNAVMALYLSHADHLRSPETAKHHARRVEPWTRKFRASQARECAAVMVADMLKGYKPATINRSLGALKKALHLAWERGETPEDYGSRIQRLPENNVRDVYLDMKQVARLADHASESVRAAVWIALLTGCRRGEVLAIRTGDIGPDSITIRAGNTKTLRTRTVPIVPALRPWLKFVPLPINYEGLKSGFARSRVAAGMPGVHFHDLRHSCATILLGLGVALDVVRDILGHSTIKTTERYAHALVHRQREALERLGELHQGLTPAKKKALLKKPTRRVTA